MIRGYYSSWKSCIHLHPFPSAHLYPHLFRMPAPIPHTHDHSTHLHLCPFHTPATCTAFDSVHLFHTPAPVPIQGACHPHPLSFRALAPAPIPAQHTCHPHPLLFTMLALAPILCTCHLHPLLSPMHAPIPVPHTCYLCLSILHACMHLHPSHPFHSACLHS
jgi:hypothetical protein